MRYTDNRVRGYGGVAAGRASDPFAPGFFGGADTRGRGGRVNGARARDLSRAMVTLQVALVDYQLQHMLDQGALRLGSSQVQIHKYVQPASIDLPISGAVYLVKEKVLPFRKQVRQLVEELVLEDKDLNASSNGAVLLKGQTYLVYCGRVRLPEGCRGCLSPKSSIGRVDVMVRGVVDGCGLYDIIPGDGKQRELWLEISPRSFNVRVHQGTAMTQLMLFMSPDDVRDSDLPLLDAAELPAHAAATGGGGDLEQQAPASPGVGLELSPPRHRRRTCASSKASVNESFDASTSFCEDAEEGGASEEEAGEEAGEEDVCGEESGTSWQRKSEARMCGSVEKSARCFFCC